MLVLMLMLILMSMLMFFFCILPLLKLRKDEKLRYFFKTQEKPNNLSNIRKKYTYVRLTPWTQEASCKHIRYSKGVQNVF